MRFSKIQQFLLVLIFLFFGCGCQLIYNSSLTDYSRITVHIIGDSTASKYGKSRYPLMGWGQALGGIFSDSVVVNNAAVSGRSSKNFFDEKKWAAVEKSINPGDYVFIQFGHNDQKSDSKHHTDPFTSYQKYLTIYIDQTIAKGAIPVLLTSIHRNRWSGNQVINSLGEYPDAVRQLAEKLNVALIDLTVKTEEMMETMGESRMNEVFLILEKGLFPNYSNGIDDSIHLQANGAELVTQLVKDGLLESTREDLRPLIAQIKKGSNQSIHDISKIKIYGDKIFHNCQGPSYVTYTVNGKVISKNQKPIV